jgi:hypothetical protein
MEMSKRRKSPEDRHPFLEQLSQLWRNKTAIAGMLIVSFFYYLGNLCTAVEPSQPRGNRVV